VERAATATGAYAQLATGLTASAFTDTTIAAGATGYYRVYATTSAGTSAPASATATRTGATPALSTVRINTGGPAQTVAGTAWSGCTSVTACSGWVSGGSAYAEAGDTTTGVPPGMNNTIFTSEWTGTAATGARAFGFDVPVTNGSYRVRLHFAELNKFAPGTRVFSVDVEGQRRLTDLDVFAAAGGANRAIVRELPVTVTDGKVTIDFIRGVQYAKVSAIEILPA